MRPSVKLIVLAAAVALVAAAPPLATASPRAHAAAPTAALAGSVLPSVAHSALVGHTSPAAAVQVSLVLRPAHPGLLARMAARSSGHPGLSPKLMNALFAPPASVRSQVAAYMRAQGFRASGSGLLTMTFTGNAVQAQRAFGVSLNRYRLADGTAYRAPSGAIHLPPALAARVISVDGLSTLPLMQPLGLKRSKAHLKPQISPSDCPAADTAASSNPGSLQPADLASANGYNSQPLLTGNDDGGGENIALVEFSDYNGNHQHTYQTCYATTVPVSRVNVNGGTTAHGGSIEVDLDQEVVAGEAPGLDHIWTYVAKPSASMATMLDAILSGRKTHHVHIVSDSWGNCELAALGIDAAATDRELQLLAVAGVSFFAASGDDGASDCHRFGINALEVDDPASDPYATGVGGTNLDPSVSHTETVWGGHGVARGGGGGGVSLIYRMPTWQKGPGVIRTGLSSKKKCGGGTHFCREVPDVAFDADPHTGYVIFDGIWEVVGGTSAAAPLMAAFTADANEFSLGNGGNRMGFASPFLYHEFGADPGMFNDVTQGNNSILLSSTKYTARPGYDMASGLGSVDANEMAVDLAGYTRSAVKIQLTKITASASQNPVSTGHPTILSGKLTDTTTHKGLGGRVVWIQGTFRGSNVQEYARLHTGPHGGWSIKLTRSEIRRKFTWHAVYEGEQGHRPAISTTHVLRVA